MTARRVAALLLLAAAARADVLHVPGEFPTIAFAVEAAAPGDTILIAAGTYDEQVVVIGADGLVLRGKGKVELTGGPGDVGVDLVNCVNTTVERLRFTGQSVGVRVSGGTGVTLERCRAEEMVSQGFQVLDSQGTRVDRCLVDGALNQGLQLAGVVGGVVRRCTFRNVLTGITASDAVGLEVDRARIEDTTSTGLVLDPGCSGVDVHHSLLVDVFGTGISVEGSDNRFSHDRIVGALGAGITCTEDSAYNVFDHERVVNSSQPAFLLGGLAQEARACRAIKPFNYAFEFDGDGSHLAQDCRATSPGFSGFLIDVGCTGVQLLDNRATHPGISGFEVVGNITVLTGNVATGSAEHGFSILSAFNILTDNKAHGSGFFDLLDTDGASTYVDNDFGTESFP